MRIGKFVALFCIVLFTVTAWAQSSATGELHVSLKDPNGAVVTNGTITVRDAARNIERSVTTNTDGEYPIRQLPPGRYTVTAEAPGFGRLVADNVVITVGQFAELPLTMKVAAAAEEIKVSAEAEMVETQRTSQSTTIQQERIDNLPINGRNYINFALTNSQLARDTAPSIGAAPTSGLNVGGQRARSNLVNVDGTDAVDNSVNGIRSTVSQEAVQEFQIITNGYAAEYGRASGGVVNIITRSGTNNMHGNAFGYLRHRSFQANNHFTNVDNPPYTRVQSGFTIGGPIKKDRTFYFLSFETTRRQETGFSVIGQNNWNMVTADISRFFGMPTGSYTTLATPLQQTTLAVLPVNAGTQAYAALVARSTSLALDGAWNGPAATGGGVRAFPTSCQTPGTATCPFGINALPADFVSMSSLRGNFPISEKTDIYSLRIDHKLNATNQLMLRGSVSPSDVTGIQVNAQNQTFGQNAFSRTSNQNYHDAGGSAQETWTIGNNKVNELRFQYARRGLRYDFSRAADGPKVGVNMPGVAFFGREPFSYVNRTEQRYQFMDNFSWSIGRHNFKFGGDFNYLPLTADFTVNFGGLYNFGSLAASQVNAAFAGLPEFNPVQAYGLGLPQNFIQGVGNPHDEFKNKILGAFVQDSWRLASNVTLNYGVRYDVEFTPEFAASTAISTAAQNALGITQGIPRDMNNIAPRVGLSWDPWKDGKTAIRASYGMFYDHPLLALAFNSDVADGTQAPQLVFIGGTPNGKCVTDMNAANMFQGLLGKNPTDLCPASAEFLNPQQRFTQITSTSMFVNQNYLGTVPLSFLPFGFPTAANFEYAYSQQGNFTIERELGGDFAFSASYNINLGRHLNRPINSNPSNLEAEVINWERAVSAGQAAAGSDPRFVAGCGVTTGGKFFAPAALLNFFRPSGLNPALAPFVPSACVNGPAAAVAAEFKLGRGVPVPWSDMTANYSNGSSVYHGMTLNLRKRMSRHYEFLASYTWSHAIDDSTDLQSLLSPQENRRPDLERSDSTFDQRHRFVLSGVYQTGRIAGDGAFSKFFSNWTFAPIVEVSSGRPFTILVGSDANKDFGSNTDRPNAVVSTAPTGAGCLPPVANKFSPTGFFQPVCLNDGVMDGAFTGVTYGNMPRNSGHRPTTVFNDIRVARRIPINERFSLDAIMDVFNVVNKFNVADVNLLYTNAGEPSAAFDPRQFQFALKLSW